MNNVMRLLEAAKTGTLEDVRTAFGACDTDKLSEYGQAALSQAIENTGPCMLDIVKFLMERGTKPDLWMLRHAAQNEGPYALEIMKLLMEKGVKTDSIVLNWAAGNRGSCAFDMVKLIVESGTNPHEKDADGSTAFTEALRFENTAIADYLFSRDDFLLSDLMPRPSGMSDATYRMRMAYREKAISHVSELIDKEGLSYARTIAADIEKILKTKKPEPTFGDIEALRILAKKIASLDWVADAQVLSNDFLGYNMVR